MGQPQARRRQLFGAALLLVGTAGLARASDQAQDLPGSSSPEVHERYVIWQAAESLAADANAEAANLYDHLVQRWGPPPPYSSATSHWGHDPDYHPLSLLNDETDRLSDAATDRLDDLMASPAKNLADIALKLVAVAAVWAPMKGCEGGDYHERMTAGFLREARALLSPAVEVI